MLYASYSNVLFVFGVVLFLVAIGVLELFLFLSLSVVV